MFFRYARYIATTYKPFLVLLNEAASIDVDKFLRVENQPLASFAQVLPHLCGVGLLAIESPCTVYSYALIIFLCTSFCDSLCFLLRFSLLDHDESTRRSCARAFI